MLDFEFICRQIPGYDPFATAGDCWFDPQAAQLAVDFFPACLKHVEGAVTGKAFVLELWQQAIVANLFGWKRKDSTGRTVRRYRETLIYVPRKNGKTPLVAGIAAYVFFCDDEHGQQDYLAASDRLQAGMLFRHLKGMVLAERELKRRCRIYGGTAAAGQAKSLVRERDGSFLQVISADADSKHGGNPHLTIIDELHAQPDAELYDVLHTGMASQNRAQPLFISLTTADYDRQSVCNERYDYACDVRDGRKIDVTFLPVIFEALASDDWADEATWRKANPNLGVSVSLDYLRNECDTAQHVPRLQNRFKRLHLDMRTAQDVVWLPVEDWRACAIDPFEIDADAPIFGALDLSSKIDLTALAWAWRTSAGRVRFKARFFCPENRIRRLEVEDKDPSYRLWSDAGWLTATPGDVVDYDFIRRQIGIDATSRDIRGIAYDPWNATQTALNLQEQDGMTLIEFRQGFVSMSEPAKELERLIIAHAVDHESNPVLDWMIGNAKIRSDPSENIRPIKPEPNSKRKVDGVVAAVMALGAMLRDPGEPASPQLIVL